MAKSLGWRPRVADLVGRNDLLPSPKIEQAPITKLNQAERTVQKPSNRQISRVEASISDRGLVVPVPVGRAGKLAERSRFNALNTAMASSLLTFRDILVPSWEAKQYEAKSYE